MARFLDRTGTFTKRDPYGNPDLSAFQLKILSTLLDWEDALVVTNSEVEFQQRVLAASLGPQDPQLYWHLFDPHGEGAAAEEYDDNGVFYPSSVDELAAMFDAWDAEDAAAGVNQSAVVEGEAVDAQAWAESLGFAPESE